jgi:hypothetical protein
MLKRDFRQLYNRWRKVHQGMEEQGMEERMEIFREIIDKLLADYKGPEDLIGEQGMDGSSSSCYTSAPTNNSTKSSR